MTDQNHKRIPLVWLIVGAVMIITLIYNLPASASGDRIKQETDVSSEQTVRGDSSRAYALGGSDVDIAQCYRSFGNAFWTDTKPNLLCLADSLDARGLHEAAGKMRCSVKSVAKHFENNFVCRSLMTMEPQELPEVEEVIQTEEDDDYHEEQQAYLGELESRMARMESDRNKPKQVHIKKEVIQQPFLSDEKKAALRELKE